MSQPVLARDETEANFLAALRASPDDDVTRLVYADWARSARSRAKEAAGGERSYR